VKATLVKEETFYQLIVPAEKIDTLFYSPSNTDYPLEETHNITERKLLHGIGPLVYGMYSLQSHERLHLSWPGGHAMVCCTEEGIFYTGEIESSVQRYEGIRPFILMINLAPPTPEKA
jgi:hypothetical protein